MYAKPRNLFRLAALAATLLSAAASSARQVTDTYVFKMVVRVPRIYNNSSSKGYRKYQTQIIRGKMHLTYDDESDSPAEVSFTELRNIKHKVNGASVTYTATVDETVPTVVNVIGDNAKNEFKTASVKFGIIAEPSYIWGAPAEDNSLYVTLAGSGLTAKYRGKQVIRKLSGSVAGAIGCGCTFYGHISPTRVMGAYGPTAKVDDVASVHGTWRAIRKAASLR